jgi:hypothetical protein
MNEQIRNEVDALTPLQKLSVYMDYCIDMKGLKYNSELVQKEGDWMSGRSKEDKSFGCLAVYYLWKGTSVMTFETFISTANIRTIDNGELWRERGFAQRVRVDYFGIYDWYWKRDNLKIAV